MPLASRPHTLSIAESCSATLLDSSSSTAGLSGSSSLEVHDPVHGTCCLGPICALAVDTAPVQRLQHLQQLGRTSFAFPSAVHTRFAHSLGTAHLAACSARHLVAAEQEGGGQAELDIELTALAGLCHDLGHGPFSHSFDTLLQQLPGGRGQNWSHEAMSCKLLEAVMQEAGLDLDSQQLQQVQDMIDSSRHKPPRQQLAHDQAWRLQIVSNATNSIDVDKLDYMVRDIHMTGVVLPKEQLQASQHFPALMTEHCKVLLGHIGFSQQHQQTVAALFDTRAALHERVYQHPVCKAAELMDADALLLAEPVINILDKLDDPEAFCTLDDTIVSQIIASSRDKHADPCLVQASALLQRMQRRDGMYFLAAEAELLLLQAQQQPNGVSSQQQQLGRLTVADVVRCQQQGGAIQLTEHDIRLYPYTINYCFGAEDPLEHVSLYDPSTGALVGQAHQGIPRPAAFLSNRVRVYVARQCSSTAERHAYADAASAAFSNALRMRYGQHWRLIHPSQDNISSRRQSATAAAMDLLQRTVILCTPQLMAEQPAPPWQHSSPPCGGVQLQDSGMRAAAAAGAPLGDVCLS